MTATILCAIDERTEPEVARTAGELAASLDSQAVLVHVVKGLPDPVTFHSHAQRERSRHHAIDRGHGHVQRMRAELPVDQEARDRVELGSPVAKLLQITGDEDAKLIVVGSRGRGAVRSALLGSVSRSLVEQAPCPVVIVTPGAAKYHAGRPERSEATLVCGIDGSEPSLRAARLAADLAERFGDRPVLLHAYDARGRSGVPGLADAGTAPDGTRLKRLIEPGPPAYAIEALANREGARLIVVGARRMSPLRSALGGSVSAQLVGVAGCPVVVLPEHAELAPGSGHYEISSPA